MLSGAMKSILLSAIMLNVVASAYFYMLFTIRSTFYRIKLERLVIDKHV
jgi:hypothetical protein